jgi:putative oxidoreductase
MAFGSVERYALALLRIVSAFTFFLHGVQKIFGVFGGVGGSGARAVFPALPWISGMMELVGGILLMLGLFTRPVAFLLSGMMAVAYFTQHAPRGTFPIANGGELAVLYCFIFLYLAAAGSGAWSVRGGGKRR